MASQTTNEMELGAVSHGDSDSGRPSKPFLGVADAVSWLAFGRLVTRDARDRPDWNGMEEFKVDWIEGWDFCPSLAHIAAAEAMSRLPRQPNGQEAPTPAKIVSEEAERAATTVLEWLKESEQSADQLVTGLRARRSAHMKQDAALTALQHAASEGKVTALGRSQGQTPETRSTVRVKIGRENYSDAEIGLDGWLRPNTPGRESSLRSFSDLRFLTSEIESLNRPDNPFDQIEYDNVLREIDPVRNTEAATTEMREAYTHLIKQDPTLAKRLLRQEQYRATLEAIGRPHERPGPGKGYSFTNWKRAIRGDRRSA